jgi:hypothetical protein
MQTVARTAIRIGRATALAVGVGVMLALVLGLTTVALAAVPGDPFKLGKVNQIKNATTTLRASFEGLPIGTRPVLEVVQEQGTDGPALRVENASTQGIGGQAIQVKVPSNRPPISVNPDAGTAIGLSADKLDGKDQEDFLSASRIYGKTALKTGPGGGDTVLFTALDGPEGLACDEGDVAIDASANANDINDDLNNITRSSLGSYQIEFQDNGDGGGLFRASITCSDSSKPFRD